MLDDRLAEAADVIGAASAVVHPAAGFAEVAASRGARTIEINPDETPITDVVDISLRGPAGRVLPEFVERAGAVITRG